MFRAPKHLVQKRNHITAGIVEACEIGRWKGGGERQDEEEKDIHDDYVGRNFDGGMRS